MPSYGFCFRASTRKGGGAGRLYLRALHQCQSRSVTTNYRILPEEWDATRRRLIVPYGRSNRARELARIENDMMGDMRRMDAVIQTLEKEGHFTVDQIMERYRNVMTDNTVDAFTERLAGELDRAGHFGTAKAYRTAVAKLQTFVGENQMRFEVMNPSMLAAFQQFLKDQKRSMNTISCYMRTLRAIYNKAVEQGRLPGSSESPFAAVYTGTAATRKLALTHYELAKLSALDPTVDDLPGGDESGTGSAATAARAPKLPHSLGQALAMFLFCYHARGMCFVDMANLRKSDLRGDTIRYRRAKTGQAIELRVLPAMRRIIDWFAPETAGSRYVFPVIDDTGRAKSSKEEGNSQYESGLRLQNMRLKKVAARCGISKRLSTHCARHSWATVAKSAGLPLAVISEGLGHSNQRTTEIYLASLERSVLDHAAKVVSEAICSSRENKTGRSRNKA